MLKVGVLALQGSVKEHVNALKKLKVEPVLVKLPYDLKEINGLILPGGESTTMGKLMRQYGLDKEIKRRYKDLNLEWFKYRRPSGKESFFGMHCVFRVMGMHLP